MCARHVPGFSDELRQHECRQRGKFRRFHNDSTPARKGRGNFPSPDQDITFLSPRSMHSNTPHVDWVIPWNTVNIVVMEMYRETHGKHVHLSANPNRIMPSESKLCFVVDFDGLIIEKVNNKINFVKTPDILVQLFYPPTPHSTASTEYYRRYRNP